LATETSAVMFCGQSINVTALPWLLLSCGSLIGLATVAVFCTDCCWQYETWGAKKVALIIGVVCPDESEVTLQTS